MIREYLSFINERVDQSNRFNKIIDYTYLNRNATVDKIKQVCSEAKEFGFYSVCVRPDFVSYADNFLDGTNVKVCAVVSFPEGTDKTIDKVKETEKCIIDGADEIDMVMNYKMLKKVYKMPDGEDKQKKMDYIENDISSVARVCHGINSVILKVIIETGELTYDQIKIACDMCVRAGADYVKTSTGFAKKGAEEEKVRFMRKILPDTVKVKASGGIRTNNDIKRFVDAGADRIGTSSNPSLLN